MSDWEQRTLCPDGSCVGVIGADGTCKVCGRVAPNWGDERKRGLAEEPADAADDNGPPAYGKDDGDEVDDEYEDDDEDGDDEGDDSDDDDAPAEWSERKLCPDGGCVGLIGDSGACNVCGRSAA